MAPLTALFPPGKGGGEGVARGGKGTGILIHRVTLFELIARLVLEIANKVPVGDVFHTVHADAVNLQILHPPLQAVQWN